MKTQFDPELARNAQLLLAAVQLRQSHGLLYAMRLLEEHEFSATVIWELFDLLPRTLALDVTLPDAPV